MRFTNRRRVSALCLIGYCGLMLWLLFIRHRSAVVTDYWGQISARINLIPFSSIGSMLVTLRENPRLDVLWVVIYNLGGNIILFLPLGFLLPELWTDFRRLWRCLAAVAGIMVCVELIQLFTLRGFCETDDVMLNVLGGAIGHGIWKLSNQKT